MQYRVVAGVCVCVCAHLVDHDVRKPPLDVVQQNLVRRRTAAARMRPRPVSERPQRLTEPLERSEDLVDGLRDPSLLVTAANCLIDGAHLGMATEHFKSVMESLMRVTRQSLVGTKLRGWTDGCR